MSERLLGPHALAKLTGVSTDTLRHYERLGLLPGIVRTSGGYRRYRLDAVERVGLIKRALVIGFTLKELAGVLHARDRGTPPCGKVRSLVGDRLAALERRLEELVVLRDQMKLLLRDWDERLARTPQGQRARLLDMIAERKGLKGKSNQQLSNRVIG